MQVEKRVVIELTISEVKDIMIDYFKDMFLNDPVALRENISNGFFVVPDFKNMKDERLIDLFCELEVEKEVRKKNNATHVVVRKNNDSYEAFLL